MTGPERPSDGPDPREQPDYFVSLPASSEPDDGGGSGTSGPPPGDGDGRDTTAPTAGHGGAGPSRRSPLVVTMAVLVLAAGAVAVGLVVWLAPAGGSGDGDRGGGDRAVAAPSAITEDGFRVWGWGEDGLPIRWDPCTPIRWTLNLDHAPPSAEVDINAAMSRIGQHTGIEFAYDGPTDEVPGADRAPFQPDRYGTRWAPVLIAWVSPAETDLPLGHNDRGVSVPVAVKAGADESFVTGQIVFNADRRLEPGFGNRGVSWGATILHELGHLVGLDHVDDRGQLMYPFAELGPAQWGAGDLRGLAAVGSAHGCVDIPAPQELDVEYRDDFGS